jgi:hypothetical protein
VTTFTPLIRHRIRKFQVTESVDDCLQQILLSMITPSAKLGTSYLERYDPSRGTAQHYVLMFTMQQMMKLHAREKARHQLVPEPLPIELHDGDDEASGTLRAVEAVAESTIADPAAPWEALDQEIRTPADLRRLLGRSRHAECRSYSPTGEPRSTLHMLELLIWGGLSITEIAARLAITTAEVHRRFKLLRKEPSLAALLQPAS